MIRFTLSSFSVQKLGNSPEENEDSVSMPNNCKDKVVCFALSDGATESSFAREWSGLLVKSYTEKSFSRSKLPATIKALSQRWHALVGTKDLPWYAQQKLAAGAFATFLGVTIDRKQKLFDSVAIGDTALFLIRNKKMLYSFPLTSSGQFGNTPELLCSNEQHQTDFSLSVRYAKGEVEPGDQLILASDALSEWLFRQMENDKAAGKQVTMICEKKQSEFADWLNQRRKRGEIKNDDSTLISINFF